MEHVAASGVPQMTYPGMLPGQIGTDPNTINIGIDIGQRVDFTALCAVEVWQRRSGRVIHTPSRVEQGRFQEAYDTPIPETVFTCRRLERLPLGTPYPAIAARLADVVCSPVLAGRQRRVFIDVTGVGRPVYDLLTAAIKEKPGGRGVEIRAITFTSGDKYDRATRRLGKAFLVSRLQALLQQHLIQLPPDHPEARIVAEELKVYEIRVSQDGDDTYGAFKVGSHDDYVTAIGLAALESPFDYQPKWGASIWQAPPQPGHSTHYNDLLRRG